MNVFCYNKNMKKLNIPLILQNQNSVDCGLACVAMILDFYSKNKTILDIQKEISVGEDGAYLPQLGLYLVKLGFEVEIITQNPFLFTVLHRNFDQQEILRHFKSLLNITKNKDNIKALHYFIDFIEAGGRVVVKIPTFEDIKSSLENNFPVVASYTSVFLKSKEKPFFNFHNSVVKGFDKENIIINNPAVGEEEYLIDDFMFAIHSSNYRCMDNGGLLIVKKRKL